LARSVTTSECGGSEDCSRGSGINAGGESWGVGSSGWCGDKSYVGATRSGGGAGATGADREHIGGRADATWVAGEALL
jgi:hypothetical protein